MIRADVGKVLALGRQQIGTVEQPARSGRQKYGRWYGMDGAPWCAMFVSWVFWHAGSPLPAIRTKRGFAYVPDARDWAQRNGCWKRGNPQPGDLVLYSFGGYRPDHVGIVDHLIPGGVAAIEGNTSGTNPRMGGMVALMHRRTRIVGYVDITDHRAATPITVPTVPKPIKTPAPLEDDVDVFKLKEPEPRRVFRTDAFQYEHIDRDVLAAEEYLRKTPVKECTPLEFMIYVDRLKLAERRR